MILEVILIFIMDGQCIHFAFKGACLSPILLWHSEGKGIGVFSTSYNNRLFWYLDYPGGIVCCEHIPHSRNSWICPTNWSKFFKWYKILDNNTLKMFSNCVVIASYIDNLRWIPTQTRHQFSRYNKL